MLGEHSAGTYINILRLPTLFLGGHSYHYLSLEVVKLPCIVEPLRLICGCLWSGYCICLIRDYVKLPLKKKTRAPFQRGCTVEFIMILLFQW